jgi:hypothetical protein
MSYDLIHQKYLELKPFGFLKHFASDLVVDKKYIEKLPKDKCRYFWSISSGGTGLLTEESFALNALDGCRYWLINLFIMEPEILHVEHKLFYFDGNQLTEVKDIEAANNFLNSWTK